MSEKVLEKKRAANGRCVDVIEFVKPDGSAEKRTKFVKEDGRPGEKAPAKKTAEAKTETKKVDTSDVKTDTAKKTDSGDLPGWVVGVVAVGSIVISGAVALLFLKPRKPAAVLSIVREQA